MYVDDNQRNVRNSIIDLMQNLSVEVEGTPGHVRTGARTRTESEGEGESGTRTRRLNTSSQGGKQTPNNLNTEGTRISIATQD